jgi:serine/threonine-protein kinase
MFEQGQIFADRYTIEELLGEGGFSYVFKATQVGLGRPVALKIIHARRLSMPLPDSSEQQLDRLHERFEQEARTISQLASPHTVTLYDYGIDAGGCPFMVLEYIDGMDLSELIVAQGQQPPERVIEIMRQVLESLAEAHAYGLLHRDIKPANIVMTQDVRGRDQVKLLDFGLAKVFASGDVRRDLTSESQIIGTPRYMSPEQIMTPRDLTAASDLYSLGLVGYELLTGRPAVDGVDTMSLIAAQISNESFELTRDDGVPAALTSVINRMLHKDASRRFASAEEALAALDAAQRGVAVAPLASPSSSASSSPGSSSERKLIVATLAAALLAGVLGVVAFMQSGSTDNQAEAAEPAAETEAASVATRDEAPAPEPIEDAVPADTEAEVAKAGGDPTPESDGDDDGNGDDEPDAVEAAEPEVAEPEVEAPRKKAPKKSKKTRKTPPRSSSRKDEEPREVAKPKKQVEVFIMKP